MEGKKQLLQETVDRRKENQELRRKNRRWKLFGRLFIAVVAVGMVFPSIFFLRVAPMHQEMWSEPVEKSVVIPSSEYRVFQRNYNQSLENGFCLFGYVDDDRVMVREVAFVENPEHQDESEIRFSCIGELKKRWDRILLSSNYNFLGSVHTHPYGSSLSRPDARNLGSTWWWRSVKGIYNGEQLNFFAYGEPREALDMSIISFGGDYLA